MKRHRPEYNLQLAVARYLNLILPSDSWWTFIPGGAIGGGATAARRGAQIKAMGYAAGSPDLIIAYRARAVFIELKAQTGRLSDAQKFTHAKLREAGAFVGICHSIDEVREFLSEIGMPLRVGGVPTRRKAKRKAVAFIEAACLP